MWVELIAPFKHEPDGTIAELWSDTVESIRKDVECVFGMLKKRFMILKHPMRFPKQQTIGMVFRHMRRQLAIANAGDERALGPDEEAADDDDDDDVTISALEEYRQRRNLLVDHFTVASRKGEVIWFS